MNSIEPSPAVQLRTNIPTVYGEMTKRHQMRTLNAKKISQLIWNGGSTLVCIKSSVYSRTSILQPLLSFILQCINTKYNVLPRMVLVT